MSHSGPEKPNSPQVRSRIVVLLPLVCLQISGIFSAVTLAKDNVAAVRFKEQVQPILETYCYGCHGYGANEGGRTLDEFESDEALVEDIDLWWAVLKNVRAGIMPPAGEDRPNEAQRRAIFDWIKYDAFGIDPADPDPGRITLRRLNRVEYRNTIRDLMGVDYDTSNQFPADDAGYGFDNIGDVLSVSPLLLEKYLKAAGAIVAEAVPLDPDVVAEQRIAGRKFRGSDRSITGERLSYYTAATVTRQFNAKQAGKYRIIVKVELDGSFEYDPARCRVNLRLDDATLHEAEYGWADDESKRIEVDVALISGKHDLVFKLQPLVSEDERLNSMDFCIRSVTIRGPLDEEHLVEDKNYRRFFPKGPPPDDPAKWDEYAREVLRAFAARAYRRPVDEPTVDRLAKLAKQTYTSPGQSFEGGIRSAMVAVLASPRFLFRVEDVDASDNDGQHSLVDQFALASRLSYFLWSTMPDDELMRQAERGELRSNLPAQVQRMLMEKRSESLIENFVGQWLRSRDVEHTQIDPLMALGLEEEFDRLREEAWKLRRERRRENAAGDDDKPEEERQSEEAKRIRAEFRRLNALRDLFSDELRRAMRRETEMYFEHIIREDRSLLELVDSNYTFLNEALARHYGIDGVNGREMRRVELPANSPRGGVLTHGTLLVVTSNPTRTSPVKRGLYILDNILGTPPPPPPAEVPQLEAAAAAITDHQPTIRELQEQHRRDALCHACHARMDPLGLALENFNALGMWRDSENGRPIDPSGELLTGEEFKEVRELKRILKDHKRLDLYRCVTEKLLTYALGRGLEYYDEHTVDEIVDELERNDGRFSTLLMGVVQSAPFQKRRADKNVAGTLRVP